MAMGFAVADLISRFDYSRYSLYSYELSDEKMSNAHFATCMLCS